MLCLVPSSNVCCFLQYKESTKTINDVLEEKSKEQWRRSNKSLAMEIAEITESFGKELADKWSNETSAVGSSEDNIGEQNLFFTGLSNPNVLLLDLTLMFDDNTPINNVSPVSGYTRFVKF